MQFNTQNIFIIKNSLHFFGDLELKQCFWLYHFLYRHIFQRHLRKQADSFAGVSGTLRTSAGSWGVVQAAHPGCEYLCSQVDTNRSDWVKPKKVPADLSPPGVTSLTVIVKMHSNPALLSPASPCRWSLQMGQPGRRAASCQKCSWFRNIP